jgi:hypothetical protein
MGVEPPELKRWDRNINTSRQLALHKEKVMKLKIVGGEVMRKSIIQSIVIITIALAFSAAAKSSLAQCRTVDLSNLKLEEDTNFLPSVWHIKDLTNEWMYVFRGDDPASRFYAILQAYKVKTICHVPGSGDSVYGYYDDTLYDAVLLAENGDPITGDLLPTSPSEQCVALKPGALHIAYSDSEQAKVLTDGSTVLEENGLYSAPLEEALTMIQQYSLDTRCAYNINTTWWRDHFSYYKRQHPLEIKTIPYAITPFQRYGKVAPHAALDDRTLRGEVAAINDQTTAMMRLLAQEINARAIKWPPNPHDPIIREMLARAWAIQTRIVSVYSRPRSSREPQGLKTFGALRPLANQLHQAIERLIRSRDANSGNASLKQIASIVQATKAKAAEIK